MNAIETTNLHEFETMPMAECPDVAGTPTGGGFFATKFWVKPQNLFVALIVAPKDPRHFEGIQWKIERTSTLGARSLYDGYANLQAMDDDLHPIAKACRALEIGGKRDWYPPSKNELSAIYEALAPCSGGNPEQTVAEGFRDGEAEAYEPGYYLSSTEFSTGTAWLQNFGDGLQHLWLKNYRNRCRAVRKCKPSLPTSPWSNFLRPITTAVSVSAQPQAP